VDKLEQADAERQKEGDSAEHKSIILPEPQLMLTAGPGMGMPPGMPQYAPQYAAYGQVPPQMPYGGGYGGM
jgi:clathrin heavy chain